MCKGLKKEEIRWALHSLMCVPILFGACDGGLSMGFWERKEGVCTTCGQADAARWGGVKADGTPAELGGRSGRRGCAGEGSRLCCCPSAIESPMDPERPERSCVSLRRRCSQSHPTENKKQKRVKISMLHEFKLWLMWSWMIKFNPLLYTILYCMWKIIPHTFLVHFIVFFFAHPSSQNIFGTKSRRRLLLQ